MSHRDEWPSMPFQKGDRVRTANKLTGQNYTPEGQKERLPGMTGTIIELSNSHGLCFEVNHDELGTAWYDPEELTLIKV